MTRSLQPWKLVAAALALGACGSPDLCTRLVNSGQKFENQFEACFPDAGLPPDTEAPSEIDHCKQQLATCTSQDQSLLSATADCFDRLPALNCQWFAPSDAGLNQGLLLFALEALACEPTKPLSPNCQATSIPLDGGFGL